MNFNFFRGDYATGPMDPYALVLGLMLAFLSGQTIAWVYMTTHSGLSYSKSFVNSLILRNDLSGNPTFKAGPGGTSMGNGASGSSQPRIP